MIVLKGVLGGCRLLQPAIKRSLFSGKGEIRRNSKSKPLTSQRKA